MNKLTNFIIWVSCGMLTSSLWAQDAGRFSGGLQTNANVFMRDSLIGAFNIPQYDYQLFGAETWLDLNYNVSGFDLSVRFDLFNNSNLLDPNSSYSGQGIGRWHIEKKVNKLGIKVGHIYDQIGSGIIYRAYQERPLLIDNALYGARLTYDILENWEIKAFTGRQRFLFDAYPSNIKGLAFEGFLDVSGEERVVTLAPGFGFVNRTLDDDTMTDLVDIIKTYQDQDRVIPVYNTYLFTVYNNLTAGKFNWFVEASVKSSETFNDPNALKTEITGVQTFGKLVRESGSVLYSSLSFASQGLGITLEGKRTENFDFRASPLQRQLRGLINFIPPMNRQNTYRLTTRYAPATQFLSEQAFQADVKYKFSRAFSAGVNTSFISELDGGKLYRELYTEFLYKHKRQWQLGGGLQLQEYNQEVYEVKPEVPLVTNVVPYLDFLYRFSRKKSIRAELQYMFIGDDENAGSKQDYGNWLFALVEFSIAPHWSFTVSDMYNSVAGVNSPKGEDGQKLNLHYPRIDIYYTIKANRFSLSYVKQVEGVVCSGGICRLEPAFSGFKFSASSTF